MQLYGIRHHGPGSARSLLRALHAQRPDCILIEGPPDADALLTHVAHADMVPPVALLIYNPKNLRQASFFPFAEFSPEWQAVLYGLAQGIPVRFMDLPMSLGLGLKEMGAEDKMTHDEVTNDPMMNPDPFREMANLAGYSDPERWWEAMFERGAAQDIFPVVVELMTALRGSKSRPETRETLLREAFMRQTIRAAAKEGFENVAVVCGAWHTPALVFLEKIKPTDDAALLKGLKKVKTEATWIPWSFDRLSVQSGYGAGVLAPAWYRILWQSLRVESLKFAVRDAVLAAEANSLPSESRMENLPSLEVAASQSAETGRTSNFELRTSNPSVMWLTSAARLLREHDVETSSAHVIEAVRLADTLAVLRHTEQPGIEELREAAISVLGLYSEKPLELLDGHLVVGDVLGQVPASLPVPPLKADFEAQASKCNLKRSTMEEKLELDLRKDAHLRKSILLHRANLLGIRWGRPVDAGSNRQGRFHEHWQIKWLPDYEIRLIEAGTWGNTVESAALQLALQRIEEADTLPPLSVLLEEILKAELGAALPILLHKLQTISALSADALRLADTVPPLVSALRYGQARHLDLSLVEQQLEQLVPRLCLQLPAACTGVNEDVAAEVMKKMLALNRAFSILQSAEYDAQWQRALRSIHDSDLAAPLLAGLCSRLLFDKNWEDGTRTGDTMRFRLSAAQLPADAAAWLEGFLHGSGLLLLHHPALWSILDGWVRDLPADFFQQLLPLLRRTFSRFAPPERGKMLDLAKNGGPSERVFPEKNTADWDVERAKPVLDLVRGWFGL